MVVDFSAVRRAKSGRLPAHGPLVATVANPRGEQSPRFPSGLKCCCYAAAIGGWRRCRTAEVQVQNLGDEGAPCDSTLETKTVAGPKATGYRVIALGGPSKVVKRGLGQSAEDARPMTAPTGKIQSRKRNKNNVG